MKERKKLIIYQIVLGTISVLLLGFFTYLSLATGDKSSVQSGRVSKILANVFSFFTQKEVVVTDKFNYLVRKLVGHYGYFIFIGISCSLFFYSFDKYKYYVRIIINNAFCFTFAFISEFLLQAITSGRSPSMIDVLIDYAGFFTSMVIITIIIMIKNKKRGTV